MFAQKRIRKQVEELEARLEACREENRRWARLASFPEQNPDLIIEMDPSGKVTYLNPVAMKRFPELAREGTDHPLLNNVPEIAEECIAKGEAYHYRDVTWVRIFAMDITEKSRAQDEVAQLAAQLQRLTQKLIMAQEEERGRLSRELHDESGQSLIALKMSLEILQDDLKSSGVETNGKLVDIISLADSTREQIRRIAQDLRPPALDTLGLNTALEEFSTAFARRTNLSIVYEGTALPDLPDAYTVCLYRFLQEALTNVAEHAIASEICVRLFWNEEGIFLSVQDDGIGMEHPPEFQAVAWTDGLGLQGMQERLTMLGGYLKIKTAVGEGTELIACLPLEGQL